MTEEREPRDCTACGAVNPWMNETCRVCGAALAEMTTAAPSARAGAEPEPGAKPAPGVTEDDGARRQTRPTGPWNPRWVLVGGALFTLLFMGGEKLIEHLIVANDPVLKQLIEEQVQKQQPRDGEPGQDISEGDKQRLRGALTANRALVLAGLGLFLLTPLLVGAVVGYFSGAVRNGAVACGLGTMAVMLMSYQVLYGLVFGLVYAGLGALGALAGRQLRRRRSRDVFQG